MRSLILTTLLVPSLAAANPIEIGAAFGGHSFSHTTELGATDDVMAPGPSSGSMLGARVAVPFGRRLAVEGEAMLIPTRDDVLGDRATVLALRAHARFDLLTGRVRPFVVLGTGGQILRSSSPQITNDADLGYHWGAGARVAISRTLELRIDARHLIVPGRMHNDATSDFELSLGATYRFGGKRPRVVAPPPVEVPPEPADEVITEVAPPPPPPPAAPSPPVIEPIQFGPDSADLDVVSTAVLEHAYEVLAQHPKMHVEISGHTSAEGVENHNLDLSLRRADIIKAYLVKRGISPDRLLVIGHGSDAPVDDNRTEEGRRKNRRIEFRVLRADEI